MEHLSNLISDLALILITGAITTLIFRKIKQPLVLGYIIAGFFVGPYVKFVPTVTDTANIKTLAEIGVIFLLFSLGLEFSFKKLMRVGSSASITALVEIVFITAAGYFAGILMGWSAMDSLFLGGMLASSSTTIIIRAFEELGIKTKQYAQIVFGVLVVEDIVVILLMVLLSTIAVTKQFAGSEILATILRLGFFLALWFIMGIFLLPTLLKRAKSLLDEETLLVLSVGLCLGMVVLATQVGFSAELGAFIMGSIIAETTSAERVEHVTKPVKDLFGAVFFVSIGMMIDPQAIMQYGGPVIAVTLLTLFGKLFSTTLGAIISGQPLKQSVQVGMSMAQIGEFAFIVATLGLSLGVISDFLFPIAVGASAITTFTTPYLIKFSEPLYRSLERLLPTKFINWINEYSSSTQDIQTESEWKVILKSFITVILTNSIILFAIIAFSINFLKPFLIQQFGNTIIRKLISLIIPLIVASPFLWALMIKRLNDKKNYKEMWLKKDYRYGPLLLLEIVRVLIGLSIISFLVFQLFNTRVAIFIAVPITVIIIFVLTKRIRTFYHRIEVRFIGNLNARENDEYNSLAANVSRKTAAIEEKLLPWDAHIVQLEVLPQAEFIGRTLEELRWREKYGINIVYVKRGEKLFHNPVRNSILLPFDQVGVIATDDQIQFFKPIFDTTISSADPVIDVDEIALQRIVVNEHTKLKGITIQDSGIRERTNGLIVGLERDNQRILNPKPSTVFEMNDIIWIVGERKKIQKLTTAKVK